MQQLLAMTAIYTGLDSVNIVGRRLQMLAYEAAFGDDFAIYTRLDSVNIVGRRLQMLAYEAAFGDDFAIYTGLDSLNIVGRRLQMLAYEAAFGDDFAIYTGLDSLNIVGNRLQMLANISSDIPWNRGEDSSELACMDNMTWKCIPPFKPFTDNLRFTRVNIFLFLFFSLFQTKIVGMLETQQMPKEHLCFRLKLQK